MGRTTKQNLDYFPVYRGFQDEKKLIPLRLKFGLKATMIYLELLQDIYFEKGYYVEVNQDLISMIVYHLGLGEPGLTPEVIQEVIDGLVEKELFDQKLYKEKGILTSRRIQEHYLFSSKVRKQNFVNYDFWLVDDETMEQIAPKSIIYKDYLSLKNKFEINPVNDELIQNLSPEKDEKTEINPESKSKSKSKSKNKSNSKSKRKEKESESKTESQKDSVPEEDAPEKIDWVGIKKYWNDNARGMRKIASFSDARKKAYRTRLKEHGKSDVRTVIIKSLNSDFMNGANDRGWVADFDWILNPNNFLKILEGKYDNKTQESNFSNNENEKSLLEMMQSGEIRFDENGNIIDDSSQSNEIEFEIVDRNKEDDTRGINQNNWIARTDLLQLQEITQ